VTFYCIYIPFTHSIIAVSLSSATDALNAVGRLQELYDAEILTDTKDIDSELPVAIRLQSASFSWDSAPPAEAETGKKVTKSAGKKPQQAKPTNTPGESTSDHVAASTGEATPEKVFKLHDINLEIPRGQLVAIVGAVGSGKSSFLQGLIGGKPTKSSSAVF